MSLPAQSGGRLPACLHHHSESRAPKIVWQTRDTRLMLQYDPDELPLVQLIGVVFQD